MPEFMAQLMMGKTLWWALCAVLVISVQAGLWLDREKIGLARKHFAVCLLGGGLFLLIGVPIIFGAGTNGFIGFGLPGPLNPTVMLFALYQLSLCAIVLTILTQIISGQTKQRAYAMTIFLTTGLIYPLIGHWVWGNRMIPDNPAFLADVGFIDGAGGSIIHVVAASIGLAFLLAVGTAKIPPGKKRLMPLIGVGLVLVGWVGFYGPLLGPATDLLAEFLAKTLLAGAGGAGVGLVFGIVLNRRFNTRLLINGLIAGLVSLCAGIAVIGYAAAFIIAIAGAGVALGTAHWLAQKSQHGTALGVVCVHGLAGAVGTILVAGYCDPSVLVAGSRMMQFSVQIFGTILISGVSFGLAYGALMLLKKRLSRRAVRSVPVPRSKLSPARPSQTGAPGIAAPILIPQLTEIIAQHRDISTQLQRSSERLVAMLEELRRYTKTRVETITLSEVRFNLRDLVADVMADAAQQGSDKVTFKTFYHPSLPQDFIADSGRIRQILTHLLANAVQYAACGAIILKVDGKQTKETIDLVIGVADTGVGIAPDRLNNLFEVEDHLSLSICKSLVTSLGGTLGVVSKLGVGSTFWIRVPLRFAPTAAHNIFRTAA